MREVDGRSSEPKLDETTDRANGESDGPTFTESSIRGHALDACGRWCL